MHLNTNVDLRDHSFCALSYNEAEEWLQAVWHGHVDPMEAHRGAQAYLEHAGRVPSPFLLNDNSQLQGPWFDSLDWLADVWVPRHPYRPPGGRPALRAADFSGARRCPALAARDAPSPRRAGTRTARLGRTAVSCGPGILAEALPGTRRLG
jgi:hypothetical protein